jgi:hypothetical protein
MPTNLLNNIRAKMSKDKRTLTYSPVVDIRYTERVLMPGHGVEYNNEYRIGVELGMAVQLPERLVLSQPGEVDVVKRNIGRAIAEEVYGDVRKMLIEAMVLLQKENIPYNSESMKKLEAILGMIHYD